MAVHIWLWGLALFPLSILLWLHRIYIYLVSLLTWDRSLVALWARLHGAATFEEWEAAGRALDHRYRIDTWRKVDKSRAYAWELIGDRLAAFALALQAGHVQALVHLLQSGLVRNLGHITAPALYSRSFVGTKYLIENYILQVCEIIRDLAALPEPAVGGGGQMPTAASPQAAATVTLPAAAAAGDPPLGPELARAVREGRCQLLTRAEKRQLFKKLRQSFGRTTLVLQGGSIFGLCHLGVARALFLRGLLPRIVTGTGTGALIAALLGTHTDDELPGLLDGATLNLSAFGGGAAAAAEAKQAAAAAASGPGTRWATLRRRLARFWNEGYFLDVRVLEQCVRDNGGDLTFEEAFRRTGRTLNITVATDSGGGGGSVPSLLNYVTAPHVLIWTAAVASNVSSPDLGGAGGAAAWYGDRQTGILCKDMDGRVVPWPLADAARFCDWASGSGSGSGGSGDDGGGSSTRHAPLQRLAQLFNVNHFVVSQARPYVVPFVEPSLQSPAMRGFTMGALARVHAVVLQQAGHLVRHRLGQLARLGWLPRSLRRLLVDDPVPGGPLLLVPTVPLRDYARLLDTPAPQTLHYWLRKGETAVWPAVAALKIRCSVELALEQACQDLASSAATPLPLPGPAAGGFVRRPGRPSPGKAAKKKTGTGGADPSGR